MMPTTPLPLPLPLLSVSASDPFDPEHSNDTTKTEILSFLPTLKQVQTLRSVSKSWCKDCDDYKRQVMERLQNSSSSLPCKVLILELQSEKGKSMNGRVGIITKSSSSSSSSSTRSSSSIRKEQQRGRCRRYPVEVANSNWLTGETECIAMKLCNLHPFYQRTTDNDYYYSTPPPELLDYSSDAKVRISHGMLFRELLTWARWHYNAILSSPFPGTFDDFSNLPSNDPFLMFLNKGLFDWWTTAPNAVGLSDGTILDSTVHRILDDHRTMSLRLARRDELWPKDGPEGANIVQNMIQFMRTWDTERVSGSFWITHIFPTGTVMVHVPNNINNNNNDEEGNPTSLGQVYLVKGHASVVGELSSSMPVLRETTILPIYDCWTYDGLLLFDEEHQDEQVGDAFRKELHDHVFNAIYSRSVSWRGPSAANGAWDSMAPLPVESPNNSNNNNNNNNNNNGEDVVVEREFSVLNWPDSDFDDLHSLPPNEAITEEHWKLGRDIADFIKVKKVPIDEPDGRNRYISSMVYRRLAYSYQENPNGLCTLSLDRNERIRPVHMFCYPVENEVDTPTYNLGHTLQAFLDMLQESYKSGGKPVVVASTIMPDEISVVLPFNTILRKCLQEEKGIRPPFVEWVSFSCERTNERHDMMMGL
jgi:hypothetical protein